MKTTSKDVPLNLRVPANLLRTLDKAAKEGARTRSGEARARLEHSLRVQPVFLGGRDAKQDATADR